MLMQQRALPWHLAVVTASYMIVTYVWSTKPCVCCAQALAANMRELQQAVQQQQEELQQAMNRCDQDNLDPYDYG